MNDATTARVRSIADDSEAHRVLIGLAHNKTGAIPPELLVQHVLAIHRDADWPLRRAALEALLRRCEFARRDGLRVASQPPGSRCFGSYQIRRAGQSARPYRTLLESLAPLRGSCDCPDYLRNALGVCKHVLTAVEHVAARPRKLKRALAANPAATRGPRLVWNPVRPLTGQGDWLERVCLLPGEGKSKPGQRAFMQRARRRFSARRQGPWPLKNTQAERAKQRLSLIEDLLAMAKPSSREATPDPALRELLRQERRRLEGLLAHSGGRRSQLQGLGSLRRSLYPYQLEGVERFLEQGRLLLADDMGLGKTVQAIAACQVLWKTERVRRGLILAPASLKFQWQREWQRFSRVPVEVVEGSPAQREECYRTMRRGFLIANYEQVLRDLDLIQRWKPELMVLDEAQRIKNWATKTAVYVKQLRPAYRLVLTGTPMENRLEELASILDWVDDMALEPKWRLNPWHTDYATRGDASGSPREVVGARNLDTLRARLAPCMLRRRRDEVLKQLPARTDTTIPVELTPPQFEQHEDLKQPIAALLRRAKTRPLTQQEFLRLMSLLTTQRIIANGLAQLNFSEVWPTVSRARRPSESLLRSLSSPKLLELREILTRVAIDQGRKVVVFSQWRRMLTLAHWSVAALLKKHGVRTAFFTGGESQRQRMRNVVDFHDDPAVRVLFASDAGGVGLNLQRAASCCINVELPWNPAVLEQRIGRIYRLGQKRPINVYNLVSQDCIESRIAGIVSDKKALFEGLFDGDCDQIRFEKSGSFLTQLERVIETPRVSADSPDEASEDEGTAEREIDEILEAADESLDELPRPADGAPTEAAEATPDRATDRSRGEVPTGQALAPAAAQLQGLFAELDIRRTADGGMRIEASPQAAVGLASALEGMAQLLRKLAV